jgi:hypothetical protein
MTAMMAKPLNYQRNSLLRDFGVFVPRPKALDREFMKRRAGQLQPAFGFGLLITVHNAKINLLGLAPQAVSAGKSLTPAGRPDNVFACRNPSSNYQLAWRGP